MSEENKENEEIVNKIKEVLPSIGYGLKILKLKDMDDITKMSLVEKRLISPDFVMNKNDIGAIAINEEENICIMINEEDHLRLQVFAPGFEIEELLKLMVEIDTKFGKAKDFIKEIEELTDKKIIHTIQEAEPIGPKKMTDIMVIAPCSRKYNF